MSSKPTTETSSGTRNPCELNARMAPIAISSLEQNTALNDCPCDSSSSTARSPASIEKSPLTINAGSTASFARCNASR